MRARTALATGALAVLGLAGCTREPDVVRGQAAPVPAAPSAGPTGPTTGATPSRPAPVATPSGTPTPPAAYGPYELSRAGVTARLPVPADWSLSPTDRGVDFGDPTGTVLLRVEIVARSAPTARATWEAAEAAFRRDLPGYRRLGLDDVPEVGDDAADLTFTFTREGVTRQVVDRGILVGEAAVAIYYSAPQELYDRMLPVFDRAVGDVRLT